MKKFLVTAGCLLAAVAMLLGIFVVKKYEIEHTKQCEVDYTASYKASELETIIEENHGVFKCIAESGFSYVHGEYGKFHKRKQRGFIASA